MAPLTLPVSAARAVHWGLLVASHPCRQTRSVAFATTARLCALPVQPRSRSVPLPAVTRRSSAGPPAGLVPQLPAPVLGTQRRRRRSSSRRGFLLTVVCKRSVTCLDGLKRPERVVFKGGRITASLPQVAAVTGTSGRVGTGTGRPVPTRLGVACTVTRSTVLGVQRAMLLWCRQTPTAMAHAPFV